MNRMIFLALCCASLCMTAAHLSSNSAHFNSVLQRLKIEENDNEAIRSKSIDRILNIRGGSDTTVVSELLKSIELKFVSLLKAFIPKSMWPKSWKSKSSKMMSKEHLEKSFRKGDSNSRIQKVMLPS
jgi:hypothetical protein